MLLKLKLALGHGQLEALDGGRHDVRVAEAELQLRLAQSGKVFADGRARSALPLRFRRNHDGVEEIFVLLLAPLLFRRLNPRRAQRVAPQLGRPNVAGKFAGQRATCMTGQDKNKLGVIMATRASCSFNP